MILRLRTMECGGRTPAAGFVSHDECLVEVLLGLARLLERVPDVPRRGLVRVRMSSESAGDDHDETLAVAGFVGIVVAAFLRSLDSLRDHSGVQLGDLHTYYLYGFCSLLKRASWVFKCQVSDTLIAHIFIDVKHLKRKSPGFPPTPHPDPPL